MNTAKILLLLPQGLKEKVEKEARTLGVSAIGFIRMVINNYFLDKGGR